MKLEGTLVFASGKSCDYDIWTLNLSSGKLNQLTTGTDWNDHPRWSPCGTKIVFSRYSDGVSSIWMMNEDGSEKKQLTHGVHCQFPDWSPDGNSLICASNRQNANKCGIYGYDLLTDNGPTEIFTKSAFDANPVISPDGTKILFTGVESDPSGQKLLQNTEIYEFDIQSGIERRLTNHSARDYSAVYSPDGSMIVFVSHREGSNQEVFERLYQETRELLVEKADLGKIEAKIAEIKNLERDSDLWVMDAQGQELRQLTFNPGSDTCPQWSPCGHYIVYTASTSPDGRDERLKIIEVSTGENVSFSYERTPLENEIESSQVLNKSVLARITPDFVERIFLDKSFWGQERFPDWKP